ncbi:fumarylacetoacetate hydrolase family protein [Jiella sp. MQZ9-1]|uniref:Fumarylacetoacetate hydrolase family protein n=1 Tax=Jiella flava TaxID=2816857 RepID=A0A939JRZ9_9HYPH|nr:fumarylacetoacetate hydrolase family protein [Jiella flava]MBO0662448.1 fumarylacetoacetate hydrolase family protein [Jiella flava]MCD2471673.1 fumarylacetoacetate hydrolase family protein [Jiella flava]
MLPEDFATAKLVGRVWRPNLAGPSVVIVRDGFLIDVTASVSTMSDFLDDDPVGRFASLDGETLGALTEFVRSDAKEMRSGADAACLLAPCDLQALKACGVTFAQSMIERVIDERTGGDPARAEAIRTRIGSLIGGNLAKIRAGSQQAEDVRAILQREGLWSQYLEVGIGPDAEVFTKSQPMSAVGYGAEVGVNPISAWNNPEPEIVLAVDSTGTIRGATLGNDVNLRDVEGRSALLLGKAKDNNASCAIGPFIRLFDENFHLADLEQATLTMTVIGTDGFTLSGHSNMAEISRAPADLVSHAMNACHQYPDGFMLFLGTMFAPVQDRDAPGSGFTHKIGDVVEIATPKLGRLVNTVTRADHAAPWTFGTRALMRNLAARGVLR